MEERRKDNQLLKEKIDEIHKDIKKVMYILNGNGEPGLVARVFEHEKYIKEQHHWTRVWLGSFIAAGCVIIIGVIAVKLGLRWNS